MIGTPTQISIFDKTPYKPTIQMAKAKRLYLTPKDKTFESETQKGETLYNGYLLTEKFKDLFLPSLDELIEMRNELYNYGLGNFSTSVSVRYWSSTEQSETIALSYYFYEGDTNTDDKSSTNLIRPVRRFIGTSTEYPLRSIGQGGGYVFAHSGGYVYETATEDLPAAIWGINSVTNATGSIIGTGKQTNTDLIKTDTTSAAYSCSIVEQGITLGIGDFHVPTYADVENLLNFLVNNYDNELSGLENGGGFIKQSGIENWANPNTIILDSLFNLTPSYIRKADGTFEYDKTRGYIATSDKDGEQIKVIRITNDSIAVISESVDLKIGFPVRLMSWVAPTNTKIYDIEGNEYNWIKIDGYDGEPPQYWLLENLKTLKLKDGSDITNVRTEWENLTTPAYCFYNNQAGETFEFTANDLDSNDTYLIDEILDVLDITVKPNLIKSSSGKYYSATNKKSIYTIKCNIDETTYTNLKLFLFKKMRIIIWDSNNQVYLNKTDVYRGLNCEIVRIYRPVLTNGLDLRSVEFDICIEGEHNYNKTLNEIEMTIKNYSENTVIKLLNEESEIIIDESSIQLIQE